MSPLMPNYDLSRLLDHMAELRELGIENVAVYTPGKTRGDDRPHGRVRGRRDRRSLGC